MSDRFTITPQRAVDVLNRALKSDGAAISELRAHQVNCNTTLANDETIQVNGFTEDGKYYVGFLGVLNGIFGIDGRTGYGPITALVDHECDRIISFELTDFDAVCKNQAVSDE